MDNLQQKIAANIETNKRFDEMLVRTKTVTPEILTEFDAMYDNDAASTANWLKAKLRVIKGIIDEGESVNIQENPVIILHTFQDLKYWITKRYPQLSMINIFEI